MATRKVDKLRPYRVDYFDMEDMIDGDRALVRSVLVQAVTSVQAGNMLLFEGDASHDGRFIIRAYRFYKKLSKQPKQKKYIAIEKLFPGVKAVEIMEEIERRRDLPVTSGPESPATKAVIQDLNGMTAHDEHEQTMDTFIPADNKNPVFVSINEKPAVVFFNPEGITHLTVNRPPAELTEQKKAPSLCPACGIGVDNDGDGDCAVCTSPAYQQAQELPSCGVVNSPDVTFSGRTAIWIILIVTLLVGVSGLAYSFLHH